MCRSIPLLSFRYLTKEWSCTRPIYHVSPMNMKKSKIGMWHVCVFLSRGPPVSVVRVAHIYIKEEEDAYEERNRSCRLARRGGREE